MSVTEEEIAHALDLFAGTPGLRFRKQTGAALIYADDVLFATVGDGEIYLKAREPFAREMAAAGSEQFAILRADGSRGTNCYWTLPPPARDDPELARAWAARALAALTEAKTR
ncbi:MAG: TfoX/Sxy family protein [Maritimibacter sp.]|nr:TfoX/Sxy family protein [Maritimibacter sp.]